MTANVHIVFKNGSTIGPMEVSSFGYGDPYFSCTRIQGHPNNLLFKLDEIESITIAAKQSIMVEKPYDR